MAGPKPTESPEPAPKRARYLELPPQCEFRPPCPGCPRYGDVAPPQEAQRELEALRAQVDAPPLEVVGFSGLGYRHRVRLSVRKWGGRPRLGIFEEGSHRLVPIARCPVHHPALIEVAEAIEWELGDKRVPAYDERAHTGLVRAVQLVVARAGSGQDADRVQVTFVVRSSSQPEPGSAFEAVLLALGRRPDVQGLFVNAQPERTNTLLGPDFALISGAPFLEQECGGARNYFPPGAFGQSNPVLHAQVVEKIVNSVPDGSRVVEYHAGVGTIGLALASRPGKLEWLTLNEVSPHGLTGLERGVRALDSPPNLRIVPGPAKDHVSLLDEADVVIVDPPRKGLEAELVAALCRSRPQRLIYLSCGLEALLREAQLFIGAGLLPTHLAAYSYFPFTDHVESLLIFERDS
jgi:23S rRNA (uracil1939-C5)-methyltransferase